MPKNTPTDDTTPHAPEDETVGKGHATPSRKEQEAARKRPLVPDDRKAAQKASRAQLNAQRDRARTGMERGEERYLPVRDKGPQKRYVRDYVDARWSVGEILLPLMVLVILTYFIPNEFVAVYALIAVWGVIVLVVIDCLVLGRQLRRKLAEKFGADKVEKVTWYAAMRAVQLRPLRLPKPQVKRGQFPV
ncbi:DUF3043 domain-containing protein [Protaetiibacter mangrovi]|uniref:DUF3043 domain-containing protein n=1 Tax=Protaetiibacter mangrovi TaxID=2970926 RepID=A0ABT1ZJ87_9MICO|nr:DUF3043 domain-containing protein [Protaetiibacter mangrovi]MCS0500763.1 DUF3043 domain-containing protein [Protaetiibacter mangrovi]TPX03410.1 DUF3043 domain-containing protein [Schumannella luteola]